MSEKDIAMRTDQSLEITAQFSLQDLEKMAHTIVKSGLFGMSDPSQAMALMLLCQASGMHPMKAVQRYDIIKGKPALKSQTMLADFKKAGNQMRWIQRDDKICEAEFKDRNGNSIVIRWTIEMAQKAGLAGKDNWKTYPRQMLSARVISEGVKAIAPEVAEGLYAPEEIMDFGAGFNGQAPTEKELNPEPQAPAGPSEAFQRAEAGIAEAVAEFDDERLLKIQAYVEKKLQGHVSTDEHQRLLTMVAEAIQTVQQAVASAKRPGDDEPEASEEAESSEQPDKSQLGIFAGTGGSK